MPWPGHAALTPADARAIAADLPSLPPLGRRVPGRFGPAATPARPVMAVQPGAVRGGPAKPP